MFIAAKKKKKKLPPVFETLHIFTPALGQAVHVTVYACSNENRVLHQVIMSDHHWHIYRPSKVTKTREILKEQTSRRCFTVSTAKSNTPQNRIHTLCQYEPYKTFITT